MLHKLTERGNKKHIQYCLYMLLHAVHKVHYMCKAHINICRHTCMFIETHTRTNMVEGHIYMQPHENMPYSCIHLRLVPVQMPMNQQL